MPSNTDVQLLKGQWVLITPFDATVVRVDPLGAVLATIHVQATVGAVPPAAGHSPGSVLITGPTFMKLSEIFAGVTGATRMYARANVDMMLSVSHD